MIGVPERVVEVTRRKPTLRNTVVQVAEGLPLAFRQLALLFIEA